MVPDEKKDAWIGIRKNFENLILEPQKGSKSKLNELCHIVLYCVIFDQNTCLAVLVALKTLSTP